MSKKILIVDDSSTMRASVEFTLAAEGLSVLKAENGQKGLDLLKDFEGQESELGMIITDINMPVMDGITLIKEIKKTSFKFTPILVMTTEAEESKKLEGKKAGASGWLIKPFNPEQLTNVVAKFVK